MFVNIASPRAAAQAIRKIAELNWKPAQYLNVVSTSKKLLGSLGEDKTKGIQSITYFKDPSSPKFKNDPDVLAYLAFINKYAPGSDPSDLLNEAAYLHGQVLMEILKKAGDNVTRDNIKNIAANLTFSAPLLIGKFHNTPTDYSAVLDYEPVVFDGHQWNPIDSVKAKS